MRPYGFKEPVADPRAYVFGGGKILDDKFPDGDWRPFLPAIEIQNVNDVETYDCTGFGATNQIEAYLKRKYEAEYNYSDRALGIVAGTGEGGNDPQTVYEAIRKNGLIPEPELPFSNNIHSIEEFYEPKPLPERLIKEALDWLARYEFKHEYVGWPGQEIPHSALKEALRHSPVGIAVYAWAKGQDGLYVRLGPDCHWTLLVAFDGDCPIIFDSYKEEESELKKLSPDYKFFYAKRIFIEKKRPVVEKIGWQKIKEVFHWLISGLCKPKNTD